MSETAPVTEHVPEPVVRVLRRLVRRARWILFLRGVCLSLWTAAMVFLCLMALDAALAPRSPAVRLVSSGLGYAVIAWAVVRWIIRPLAHSYTLAGMARLIEARHPEYQEVISSAVELLSAANGRAPSGSRRLVEEVARQARNRALEVRPERELSWRIIRAAAAAGLGTALVFLALFLWKPREATLLFLRACAPLANLPNVYAYTVEVHPGDAVAPIGGSVDVTVRVRSRRPPDRVHIETSDRDGKRRIVEIAAAPQAPSSSEKHFQWRTPPLYHAVDYRVLAGRAATRWYHIRVAEPPRIQRIDLVLTYPAYTGTPPQHIENSDGAVRGPAGTTAVILLVADKPLTAAQFLVNDRPFPAAESGPGPTPDMWRFQLELKPDMAGQWRASLTDADGLKTDTSPHLIETTPDRKPKLTVEAPRETRLSLPPWAEIPIRYIAEDDFGVRSVQLLLRIRGREIDPAPLAQSPPDSDQTPPQRIIRGEYTLRLADLPIEKTSTFHFRLRAEDTLPPSRGGPQAVLSPLFRVDIRATAPDYSLRETTAALRQALKSVKNAVERMDHARRDAQSAQRALKRQRNISDAVRRAAAQRAQQAAQSAAEAAQSLQQAAGLAEQIPSLKTDAEALRRIAAEELTRSVRALADVPLTNDRSEQVRMLSEADRYLARAEDKLADHADALIDRLERIEQARALAELAARQKQLATARRAMDGSSRPPSPEQLSRIADAESAIAQRLAEIAADDRNAVSAFLEQQQRLAQALSETAQRLADEQHSLARAAEHTADRRTADESAALAEQQHRLATEAARSDLAEEAVRPAVQAERALREQRPAEAVQAMEAARAALEKAARTAAARQSDRAHPPEPDDATRRLADLARRQEELRKQAEALAKQAQEARANSADALLRHLQEQQEEVARRLEELRKNPPMPAAPAAGEAPQAAAKQSRPEAFPAEAAEHARQAAQALEQRALEKAADEAAKARDTLAAALRRTAAPDAEQEHNRQGAEQQERAAPPEATARAEDLARRQDRIAHALDQLMRGGPELATAAAQQGIAQQTEEMAQMARTMAAAAANVFEDEKNAVPAQALQQAAAALKQAQNEASHAARLATPTAPPRLTPAPSGAQGRAQQMTAAQTRAAAALEEAARELERAVRTQAPASAETPHSLSAAPPSPAQTLTRALTAVQSAAAAPTTPHVEDANHALQAAARQAAAAAAPRQSLAPENRASEALTSTKGTDLQQIASPPEALRRLGLTAAEWGRLPGTLKTRILQVDFSDIPPEYRERVQRYFLEVAREAAQGTAP